MKKIILLILVMFITSCVTTSNINKSTYDVNTVNKESVRLIFERPKKLLFIGVDVLVGVDGQTITKLTNGSSFSYDVPSNGEIRLTVEGFLAQGKYPLIINAEKGKIYEFLIEPSVSTELGSLFKITRKN
jgi:hypothetical protein